MNKPMYYADLAEKFYESACPNHTINGYEKNVLVDKETERCIFVSGDVQPEVNELLFRCKRAHGQTVLTLKTPKPSKPASAETVSCAPTYPKRYEGHIKNIKMYDDYTEQYVLLPEELASEHIRVFKISNMDEFLESAAYMQISEPKACPYEILQRLHFEMLEERMNNCPYPQQTYAIPNALYDENGYLYTDKKDCKFYHFNFSHYEKMKQGVCAIFTFVKTSLPAPSDDANYEY